MGSRVVAAAWLVVVSSKNFEVSAGKSLTHSGGCSRVTDDTSDRFNLVILQLTCLKDSKSEKL